MDHRFRKDTNPMLAIRSIYSLKYNWKSTTAIDGFKDKPPFLQNFTHILGSTSLELMNTFSVHSRCQIRLGAPESIKHSPVYTGVSTTGGSVGGSVGTAVGGAMKRLDPMGARKISVEGSQSPHHPPQRAETEVTLCWKSTMKLPFPHAFAYITDIVIKINVSSGGNMENLYWNS